MATISSTITGFVRSDLTQEIKEYPIPFTSVKVWDAPTTNLPAVAATDDAALVVGTPGTHAPTIQGLDPGGATIASKFTFEFVLPPEYVASAPAAIRVKGKTTTSAADNACTIDFNVYRDQGDGTVGADIMASGPFSINNITAVQSDMTITASTLLPGDKIIVVGTIDGVDAGNAAAIVPTLVKMSMMLNVQG